MSILSRVIGDKRRWHEHRARVEALPAPYRTAVEGLERYLLSTGPGDGEGILRMLDDLGDLFESAAADGTPVRSIVGDDPVEFAEEFKRNYGLGAWMAKERSRLTDAVEQAEREQEP